MATLRRHTTATARVQMTHCRPVSANGSVPSAALASIPVEQSSYHAARTWADRLDRAAAGAADRLTAKVAAVVTAALEPLEGRAMMSTTYYVSPAGNDANKGTSVNAAWKSLAKVSSAGLGAGDQVLFQGGATFNGTLKRTGGNGTAASPIVIGSYGNGRATLDAGKADRGIYLYNVGGYRIQNLIVHGTPSGNSGQEGFRLEVNTGAYLAPVTITGNDVSGFFGAGITLLSDYGHVGYAKSTITNNTVHDNVVTGIFTSGSTRAAIPNVYIGYNTVYNNYGKTNVTASGNGIQAGNLQGGLIEHNVAYNNGASGIGGAGIWAYESDRVTVQYNASYNNRTTGVDGDGFDLDADTSNSVLQYNYAANNDGGGFLIDQWRNNGNQVNNVVRYNVAENNGRKGQYGNLEAWGKTINTQFYNNTVYTTASSGNGAAVRIHNFTIAGLYADGLHFANNIFVTTGGGRTIYAPQQYLAGSKNVTFQGNAYYGSDGSPRIDFGGKIYSSLSAFQSGTGQEKVNGQSVGVQADPKLVNPGHAGTGGISTGTTNDLAAYLNAYQLRSDSPLAAAGVGLAGVSGLSATSSYTAQVSGADLFGHSVSFASTTPGADTVRAGGNPTSPTPTPTPTPTLPNPGSPITFTPTPTPTGTPANTVVGSAPHLTGWDINPGKYGKTGSNSQSGSTATVTAGGADIWGQADSFRYGFTTLNGDGQIVAQVASFNAAHSWAKAGVVIRDGTTPTANSAMASVLITPNNYVQAINRSATNANATGTTTGRNGAAWVKLVRAGDTFTGYISGDGKTWTQISKQTIRLSYTAMIGVAVTSHDIGKTATATFKNISVVA